MEIVITKERAGKTVKEILTKEMKLSTRFLTKLKYSSDTGITVNGSHVTVRCVLQAGDILRLETEDMEPSEKILPVRLPLDIVYEDADIVLCNKPADMPTHPSHGHTDDTLANALAWHYREAGEPFVFRPVNRLDRNTSGLVLVAKNRLSSLRLYRSMTRGEIQKTYLAILDGVPEKREDVIDRFICRGENSVICRVVCDERAPGAMRAVTGYRVLAENGTHSLVEVHPKTGRTHQIRVHFASIGTPITGDDLYGSPSPDIPRHALHAHELTIPHPADGHPVTFRAPLAEEMRGLAERYFRYSEDKEDSTDA